MDQVIGIDGCPGGWIAIAYEPKSREVNWLHVESIHELADHPAKLMGIDMPILPEDNQPRRDADNIARELLGPKRSSVFFAPSRTALCAIREGMNYEQTNVCLAEAEEPMLSKQTWNIMPKIDQVDEVLHSQESFGNLRLVELHPELIFHFWHLNTAANPEYLIDKKRTETGRNQRIRLLQRYIPRPVIETTLKDIPRVIAQPDDILDAMVLAVFCGCVIRHKIPLYPPFQYSSFIKQVFDLCPDLRH